MLLGAAIVLLPSVWVAMSLTSGRALISPVWMGFVRYTLAGGGDRDFHCYLFHLWALYDTLWDLAFDFGNEPSFPAPVVLALGRSVGLCCGIWILFHLGGRACSGVSVVDVDHLDQ